MAEQPALSFAELLRRLRAEAQMTQEELAEAAGLSPRSVSDLERGIHRTAHKDTAVLLADALGLAEPARELFLSAARGRVPAGDVLAVVYGRPPEGLARILPNNLPAQPATFIGRDRELSEVRGQVESCRLVTLTGAGGCGKTRLGLQVAAGLLGGSGDGIWLVELAAITSEDAVAPTISQALKITAEPGRAALDTLLDALAPQDMLIVLDNCEHLIDGCAKAADAIVRRCPQVHLVATSREPLGINGETIYRVPPLSLPGPGDTGLRAAESSDAVALFIDRARAQGTGLTLDEQTAPLVVSICTRLDGLPLAIELAVARLRTLSLSALHDRLDQRFRLLTGGSRTAVARQQTLQATVDWSYSLLNRTEQLLLQRLPVFAETFDLDAAEAVCGFSDIKTADITGLLGSLVDKSLVVAEPAGPALRYRLLETIRQFATDRLAEAAETEAAAVATAHCAHYLSVAETLAPHLSGPSQGKWLARLDADQANLRRAAEHAASRPGGTAQVLRFGVALWRYWATPSRNQEAAGLLVPVLRRPEAAADPALFAEALVVAAELTLLTDMLTSLRLAREADEVASRLGDNRLLALSRGALSFAYYFGGEPERAWPPGAESVERARLLGDDVLLGRCLLAYGTCGGGPAVYAEAFACTERSGDLGIKQHLHSTAGDIALQMGEIPDARMHVEAAIRAAEALGTSGDPGHSVNLGIVLRAEQDLDGARSTFQECLRTGRRTGDKRNMACAFLWLAFLDGDQGEWYRAAMLHGVAQALLSKTGVPWERSDARLRQESLDQAHQVLGGEQLQRAYARGTALSFDQAIDLALEGVLRGEREEFQRDVVRITERQRRTVRGIDDAAVGDTEPV
jgi:predicted ATPase/transcriptional regulator with XRE-family HTH domain